jgi:hypothetical protein
MASACEQRWHTRSKASAIHAFDAKHTNIPLFEACDEVHDGRLAKVHGGKVEHHRLADKKVRRVAECCVYFFKPGNDRNHWAKYERNERSPSHANQLTCRPGNCLHEDRLAFLFEWLRMLVRGRYPRTPKRPRITCIFVQSELSRQAKLRRNLEADQGAPQSRRYGAENSRVG